MRPDTYRVEITGESDTNGAELATVSPAPVRDLFGYEYERPSVAVDLAVFSSDPEHYLTVLLIRRGKEPWKGQLALPGGFLNPNETSEAAARREATEETGIVDLPDLHLLGVFDEPDRDPRGRVISLTYATYIDVPVAVKGDDDAAHAAWHRLCDVVWEELAADHAAILSKAHQWVLFDYSI